MRTAGLFIAILALAVAGCGGGPDIDEDVRIKVVASDKLNYYDDGAHSVDVYIYKVDDPALFEDAELDDKMLVQGQVVPGGFSIERRAISPGKTAVWNVGKTRHAKYTHIGVVVTYKEAKGVNRMVYEWDDRLLLKLDPNAILAFKENDD